MFLLRDTTADRPTSVFSSISESTPSHLRWSHIENMRQPADVLSLYAQIGAIPIHKAS